MLLRPLPVVEPSRVFAITPKHPLRSTSQISYRDLADLRDRVSSLQSVAIYAPLRLAQLVSAMGLTGLCLAVIGLHGVISYSVSRRTREIGVRMAIGASPGAVVGMVLRQGGR